METIIYIICGVATILWILSCVADKRRTEAANGCNAESRESSSTPNTEAIMVTALKAMGCQPTRNQDGSVTVCYQGEHFHMEFGGFYVRVWDPVWAGMKCDDPDLPKLREAINIANFDFGPTVVMTAPDQDGVMFVHSRRDVMLHPACPDNTLYIKSVLDSFFEAKKSVSNGYQKLNAQQAECFQKRRPVGFTSSQTQE